MKKSRLFNNHTRGNGTVVMNWHDTAEREFTFFAEAFYQSAKESADILRKGNNLGLNGNPAIDFKAYPIVFLYRHALELYMKAVILIGAPILEMKSKRPINRDKLLTTHNLEKLLRYFESIFNAFDWEMNFGVPHFKNNGDLRQIISEFNSIDSGSYSFRYPIDKKGNPSLASHFTFNLFDFCNILDELLTVFPGIALAVHETLQSIYEERTEVKQYES